MKTKIIFFGILASLHLSSQIINKTHHKNGDYNTCFEEPGIVAKPYEVSIITKVIYNAIPDGYQVAYTTSFIGKSASDVESKMNKKIDNLIARLSALEIEKKDVAVDVISLDPIFDMYRNDTLPKEYKITENITFDVKDLTVIRRLATVCLEFGIYDIIDVQAYIKNSKFIYDSLASKTVQILNMKKKFCADLGWKFEGGNTTISKSKDVFYPSERYLKSYLTNNGFYKHDMSQNTSINQQRTVDVDNYTALNYKNADFIFNSSYSPPVIQFYYELHYGYVKKDLEAEEKEKKKKEEGNKQDKIYFIIDKDGNLKKIEV
jgi:uncharacterized protein YggE